MIGVVSGGISGALAAACFGIALLLAPTGAAKVRERARRCSGGAAQPAGPVAPVQEESGARRSAATFDLFAACLRTGMAPAAAAATVAGQAPAALAERLRKSAEMLALGAPPSIAWSSADEDAEWRVFARAVRRSIQSGMTAADSVEEVAAEIRAAEDDRAAAAAERAGVLIAGPLGVCFLPAFVCLGIVPIVAGLATNVLDGGFS
jgi:pilus assembly protein TadC